MAHTRPRAEDAWPTPGTSTAGRFCRVAHCEAQAAIKPASPFSFCEKCGPKRSQQQKQHKGKSSGLHLKTRRTVVGQSAEEEDDKGEKRDRRGRSRPRALSLSSPALPLARPLLPPFSLRASLRVPSPWRWLQLLRLSARAPSATSRDTTCSPWLSTVRPLVLLLVLRLSLCLFVVPLHCGVAYCKGQAMPGLCGRAPRGRGRVSFLSLSLSFSLSLFLSRCLRLSFFSGL